MNPPGPSRGPVVAPLAGAFALLAVVQLWRAWRLPIDGVAERTHAEMYSTGLACAIAVLVLAGAIEARRRSAGATRTVAHVLVGAAAVLLGAELVGLSGFARSLGIDDDATQASFRALARNVAYVRAVAWLGIGSSLVGVAWAGRATRWLAAPLLVAIVAAFFARAAVGVAPAVIALAIVVGFRPAVAPDPARTRGAVRLGVEAITALVAIAIATLAITVVMFVQQTTDDPGGLSVLVAVITLTATGVLAGSTFGVAATTGARFALAFAAAAFVAYIAISAIQLIEVLRILGGSESYGTLSTDGRAALPGELPIGLPALLATGWMLLALGWHATAQGPDHDRVVRRLATRTTTDVIVCQLVIVMLLLLLDRWGDDVSRELAILAVVVLAALAIGSMVSLVRLGRALRAG